MVHRFGAVLAIAMLAGVLVFVPVATSDTLEATPPSGLYEWHAGDDFLAAFNPLLSPAVAMSRGGERIEIRAMGTLSPALKLAEGGGTFVRSDEDGNVIASGTLHVIELVTFQSFGSGSDQGFPEFFEGGFALIRVHLQPAAGGPGEDAVLRVDCALGKAPPGQAEGVRLSILGGPNFNRSVSGGTLFLRIE